MTTKNSAEQFSVALTLLDEGDFDKGRVALEQCIESAREQEDLNTLIPALLGMADLLVQLDEFDQADDLLKEIFACEQKLKEQSKGEENDETLMQDIQTAHFVEDMLLCRRVFNKALDLLETNQIEEGEYAMQQAVALSEQKNCYDTLLPSLICMADMLIQLNRGQEARVYLERALKYEETGEAVAAIPTYKDVFADNFERARELFASLG